MRNSKIIEVDGIGEVTVKELTIAQLDGLLGQDEYTPTMLDRLLDNDMITGGLLAVSGGVTVHDLSALAPSALRPLIDAFKEVNPDFFEMARLEVRRAREMGAMLGNSLDGASAS